jgi:hypothetical protein
MKTIVIFFSFEYGVNCVIMPFVGSCPQPPSAILNYQVRNIQYSVSCMTDSSSGNKKEKLMHQSFRIEEEIIKTLTEQALKNGISLSSLVNRTLKNYVTHEMQFEELGFILVSKDFLRKVFNIIENENHIEEFGREFGLTIAKEYVSYFYPQVNSSTLILFLNLWFRRFQTFRYRADAEHEDPGKQLHFYTVTHDINMSSHLL